MLKDYYYLTKPGIIYGNVITAAAGFFSASKGTIDWGLLFAMLVGLSFIIASACVVNNIFDRGIDAKMPRTKHRAMVTGSISKTSAIVFASVLGLLGALILLLFTTHYALFTALVGIFFYVILYTPLKTRTVHATLIGSISGATPPVVGYLAVTNNFDTTALLLFLILVAWQMPHFYSIAIYRLEDYKLAGIPVLPAIKNIYITKNYIIFYIISYIILSFFLNIYAAIFGLAWAWFGIKGLKIEDNKTWARKMFRFSLVVLLVFSILISINAV